MDGLTIKIFCIAVLLQACIGLPADNNAQKAGSLKFTFQSEADIPAAFSSNNAAVKRNTEKERKVYPPCQDGSGGMCVEDGQCPTELKSKTSPTSACGSGLECCFGPAKNDKSCGSRGGECQAPTACGRQPTFKEADDCDTQKGQVCCILI